MIVYWTFHRIMYQKGRYRKRTENVRKYDTTHNDSRMLSAYSDVFCTSSGRSFHRASA